MEWRPRIMESAASPSPRSCSSFFCCGREMSPAYQYGIAGGVSFPFFWLAGAGSTVFWVLGATLVSIGSHAAFHEVEDGDMEELQMESV